MTSHNQRFVLFGSAVAACCLLGAALAGCGSSEPQANVQPVRRAPAKPPPPPRPAVMPVSDLMAQLGIDERVHMEESKAPGTTEARTKILEFFDAFARGDDTGVGSMLSGLDAAELTELAESGAWTETTARIEQIEIETGRSPEGEDCVLAVFYVGNDFQPQLWYYKIDANGAEFAAVAAPPDIVNKLHGADWIAAWFAILEEELALAEKPDEEFALPQQDYSDPKDERSSGPSQGPVNPSQPSSPSRPSSPGGPNPGKRRKGPKRAPPGKGGLPW
jgi:hypothetical protein